MVANLPKLSVIMPVYNAERYLAAAIDSILNQTYTDFEFIIIDDCSTDKSHKILLDYVAKDMRIRVFRNEINLKLPKTLNFGISQAHGKYIARMDADDVSLSDRLMKQVMFMESNLEVAMCGTWYAVYDKDFIKELYVRKLPCSSNMIKIFLQLLYNPFGHNTVMIRRNIFDQLHYLENMSDNAEDYELWLQIVNYGYTVVNLPETLVMYRVYDESASQTHVKNIDNYIQCIHKKYLQQLFGDMFTDEIADEHTELIYRNKSMGYFFKNIFRYQRHLSKLKNMNELHNIYPRDEFNAVMLQLSPICKIYNKIVKVISSKLRCD